ncbi:MAG: efflux RND transporter periplasmic adaptor subunit [Chloroflexi bacterium]|nr:MAG: efflux RND transporter periplasmic adaptor subunit [Chloroflexota bacterium]
MKSNDVVTAVSLVPTANGVASAPRMGGWARRAGWIVTLSAVGLAVGGYVFLNDEQKAPIRYKTARVERGTVISTVTATGTVNPVVSVQVSSQVPGTILSLQADFNSVVKAGAVLARIDPTPFEKRRDQVAANLEIAKANVAKARSDVAQRKRELERGQVLLQQQFISQNEVDVVRTAYEGAVALVEVAEAQVKQAEAFLDAAELDLKYTVIRSPVDGIVIARNVEVGQIVNAGFQTPSPFLIALDLTKVQVHTNVSESDIGGVTKGEKAAFTVDAYPRQVFQGRVHQVRNAPISLLNVVTYNVVVEVDNHDLRLKPGMTANVTIITARKDQVLKVPNVALRFSSSKSERPNGQAPGPTNDRADSESKTTRVVALGDQAGDSKTVWKLAPSGNPEQVPLQLGISDGTMTELVSGALKEGDEVIIGMESSKGARKRDKLPPGFAPPKEKTKKKDSA